ncbi:hypothetical protein FVEG_02002 [Fusarium verticillioides 7600]|uniref:Uncharacterized protein n=1 Tax=Gibberella moniliformis (strain M3125 / FGSC 7600) TaxID=334819 RepID=W7LKE5_GIBM7|nr:hypothetical protein FVEG_02002 [Fusarium verticillioides 7600]EWG38966.1 hypothetical protein FVEG_02002 [Fusarium verticillioides 7600]
MRTSTAQVFLHAIIMNSNGALSVMEWCSVLLQLSSGLLLQVPSSVTMTNDLDLTHLIFEHFTGLARQPGSSVSRIPAVPTTLVTVPTLSGSLTLD